MSVNEKTESINVDNAPDNLEEIVNKAQETQEEYSAPEELLRDEEEFQVDESSESTVTHESNPNEDVVDAPEDFLSSDNNDEEEQRALAEESMLADDEVVEEGDSVNPEDKLKSELQDLVDQGLISEEEMNQMVNNVNNLSAFDQNVLAKALGLGDRGKYSPQFADKEAGYFTTRKILKEERDAHKRELKSEKVKIAAFERIVNILNEEKEKPEQKNILEASKEVDKETIEDHSDYTKDQIIKEIQEEKEKFDEQAEVLVSSEFSITSSEVMAKIETAEKKREEAKERGDVEDVINLGKKLDEQNAVLTAAFIEDDKAKQAMEELAKNQMHIDQKAQELVNYVKNKGPEEQESVKNIISELDTWSSEKKAQLQNIENAKEKLSKDDKAKDAIDKDALKNISEALKNSISGIFKGISSAFKSGVKVG